MSVWRLAVREADIIERDAVLLGAWSDGEVCPECGVTSERRIPPLIMEWHGGAEPSVDFVWPGFGEELALTPRALAALKGLSGFEASPVQVVGALPLDLTELWVTAEVGIDRDKSEAHLESRCGTCGEEVWALDGLVRIDPEQLGAADVFRVREFPTWIAVTERFKDAVEAASLTNVEFERVGEVAAGRAGTSRS